MSGRVRAEGFGPVCDEHSRVLVLGSFPSVKSRAQGFYYGNPQNRFFRTLARYFGEEEPKTPEERRAFVLGRGIALWDVVASCTVVGSSDASIRDVQLADLCGLLRERPVRAILCNGNTAYSLLGRHFPALMPIAEKLPSTSPANPRFSEQAWFEALDAVNLSHKS